MTLKCRCSGASLFSGSSLRCFHTLIRVFESTCGKFIWSDMIWKGSHLSISGLTADNSWGGGFSSRTFNRTNDPKHTASTKQEWRRDNSVNVLECSSQRPDLNPIENLWRYLKMSVHRRFPSKLTDIKRICGEEWQKIPKSKCAQLVSSYAKRGRACNRCHSCFN